MFSDWISSHNLCTWLAENISRDNSFVFFHCKWFLFLPWMVSLSLFIRKEAATETCSLKMWSCPWIWNFSKTFEKHLWRFCRPSACSFTKKWTFLEVFFKGFVYCLGTPILGNTSEWLLSHIARLSRLLAGLV